MSAEEYREKIEEVLQNIWTTQLVRIERAAAAMAEAIERKGLVHLFGSGHGVLPVLDIFPRYGSFPGFHPIMDARLMWTNVVGSGGTPTLNWLESHEGYAAVLLQHEPVRPGDVLIIFSHGGMNAVDIEMGMEARKQRLNVIGVTSLDNQLRRDAAHSSGNKLSDVCDLLIDDCVPAEDALVEIEGWNAPVAAASTVAFTTIAMALVAQLAAELARRNISPPVFISPNLPGIPPDHNALVYTEYQKSLRR
ncbi:MAG: sugar isomerase domain-containing protein [Acidobacteria bacterium]|nr:sugar isomerase domain-containing protein [Acidobacteriota bacterium]